MDVTVLAGGVGAARFLRGLVEVVDPSTVTVVVNVGDDITIRGLRVCPDLDSITYHLAGVVDPHQQWGRADESHVVSTELARFGHDQWFTLGDRDIATHLHRTEQLAAGVPLSAVTAQIAAAFDVDVRLLPATDDPVATRVLTVDGRDLHFQEYWVRHRAAPAVADVELAGADDATPAPGVLAAIDEADVVLVAPSNPVVSIGTVLAVPGVRDALVARAGPVVGVSPIVGGGVVRGMADRLLPSIGVPVSAVGVAAHYRPWLDGWVLDDEDRVHASAVADLGLATTVTDTIMDDPTIAARLAATTLGLAEQIVSSGSRVSTGS